MKPDDPIFEREQLEKAIAAQEGLRGTLDDAILDTTIAAPRNNECVGGRAAVKFVGMSEEKMAPVYPGERQRGKV